MKEQATTADYANVRWWRRLTKSKRYQPSVLDQIRGAETADEVRTLLAMIPLASSGTRRKWESAARARLGILRARAIHGA